MFFSVFRLPFFVFPRGNLISHNAHCLSFFFKCGSLTNARVIYSLRKHRVEFKPEAALSSQLRLI